MLHIAVRPVPARGAAYVAPRNPKGISRRVDHIRITAAVAANAGNTAAAAAIIAAATAAAEASRRSTPEIATCPCAAVGEGSGLRRLLRSGERSSEGDARSGEASITRRTGRMATRRAPRLARKPLRKKILAVAASGGKE